MLDGDAFDSAYHRLAATRLAGPPVVASPPPRTERIDMTTPVRWAASRLLPRLDALAPQRRGLLRPRPLVDG